MRAPVGRSAARGLGALVNAARSVALPEDMTYFSRDALTAADIIASSTPLLDLLDQQLAGKAWRQDSLSHALRAFRRVVWEVRPRCPVVVSSHRALPAAKRSADDRPRWCWQRPLQAAEAANPRPDMTVKRDWYAEGGTWSGLRWPSVGALIMGRNRHCPRAGWRAGGGSTRQGANGGEALEYGGAGGTPR